MSYIDWNTHSYKRDNCEGQIFNLERLKEKFQVEEIIPERLWVAHNYSPDEEDYCWMDFAFFEFDSQMVSPTLGDIELSLLLKGNGPVGSSRECRHTYWGPDGDGYIFFPNKKYIISALTWLEKYYDLDD